MSHPAAANPTMPMAMLENDRAQAQDLPSEVLGVKIMVDKLRTAEDVKWFYEEGARLYNASMLPLEEAELRGYKWPTLKDQADMAKVMGNFGCVRGATQNGQRLLKTFVKGMDFAPGDVVSVKTVAYTICKHLFLAQRKKLNSDSHDVHCHCLPKTALMPAGCKCHKVTDLMAKADYGGFCQHCSYCCRCGGSLGYQKIEVYVAMLMVHA